MADPNAPSLFDSLAGAFGHGIDRPALNAFVANSQARNGLVSAQTQDAIVKATQAQEQQQAWDDIVPALMSKGAKYSEAQLVRAAMVGANNHDPETAMKVLGQANLGFGNPEEQVRGQQMFEGKGAAPVAVPPNSLAPPGGMYAGVTPQQTPNEAASTSNLQSEALLHTRQANDPQLFHGGANPAANMSPDDYQKAIEFGAYSLFKGGKMPAMGMGSGPARMAMMARATQMGQMHGPNGEPYSNPDFDTMLANGQDFTAGQRALNSYAGGPLGAQTKSINNVVGHLQLMENLFTGLQNGDVQVVNKYKNLWEKAFGSPIPTNVQTAAGFIGPELTKILSANNSAGTVDERQEFSHTAANLANAPEQTGGAITQLKNMLGRQMTDLALQYHGATGRSDFARRYVAPDVAQYLEIGPEAAGPNSAVQPPATSPTTSISPAGGATTTLPPQALQALQAHPGQHVTFGNGQVWTLQNGKPTRVQ